MNRMKRMNTDQNGYLFICVHPLHLCPSLSRDTKRSKPRIIFARRERKAMRKPGIQERKQ
jgi:hypothetical protein